MSRRLLWVSLGIGLVILPLAALVVRKHYLDYLRESKRAELASLSSASRSASLPRRYTSAVRRRTLGEPVADGEIVLVRQGNLFGAFIPIEQNGRHRGTVTYRWYYRTDGLGVFDESDERVVTGSGTLSGHFPTIEFGPFSIQWSHSTTGWGWVSSGHSDVAPDDVRFCLTRLRSIEGIDARDERYLYRLSDDDVGVSGNEAINFQHVSR